MKLLCVIPCYWPAFQYGGPIVSVHGLNKALINKGVEVVVYTTDAGLEGKVLANRELNIDGVRVVYFSYNRFLDFLGEHGWQFSLPMTKALKINLKEFDLVYIAGVWNYVVAAAAYYCRRLKKPYIISPRGLLYPYTVGKKFWKKWFFYRLIAKRNLKNAAVIHYTTDDEAKICHSALGLKNRAIVIPNGIELSEFNNLPRKEMLEERFSYLKGKKIILFLSRINWKKGLDILFSAYSKVIKIRHDTHLLLAGNIDRGFERRINKWVRDYKIGNSITFTGMVTGKEKLEIFAGSDLFVLPSYSENFGMAVLEAMSYGLPVIISNRVGIHKNIANAQAGIVVDIDADQLAKAILDLLDNPNICKQMSENGKRLVKERFGWEKIASEMAASLENILDAKTAK